MANKEFKIQSSTLSLNGVNIDTSATGKLVIPGITRASTSVAIEVTDYEDQYISWNAIPDVIDGYTYEVYVTGSQPGLVGWTAATYVVDALDGDGYIDGITVATGGANYTGEAVTYSQVMYAAPTGTPVDSSSNTGIWQQIPFRVRCGAGDVTSEFGGSLTVEDGNTSVNSVSTLVLLNGGSVVNLSPGVAGFDITGNGSGAGTFSTLPDFLDFAPNTMLHAGQNGEGVFFSGNAGNNTVSYPVRTNFNIPGTQKTVVTLDMVVNDECSDFSLCIFEVGVQPEFSWGTNSTRIAAQYNCTNPKIDGIEIQASNEFNLPGPGTYTVRFTYDPEGDVKCQLETIYNGSVIDTVTSDETLNTSNNYYIGFGADQDNNNLRTYIKNLSININNGSTVHTNTLMLSGGTGSNSSLPADAAGVLTNDGTGHLTWEQTTATLTQNKAWFNVIGDGNNYTNPPRWGAGSANDIWFDHVCNGPSGTVFAAGGNAWGYNCIVYQFDKDGKILWRWMNDTQSVSAIDYDEINGRLKVAFNYGNTSKANSTAKIIYFVKNTQSLNVSDEWIVDGDDEAYDLQDDGQTRILAMDHYGGNKMFAGTWSGNRVPAFTDLEAQAGSTVGILMFNKSNITPPNGQYPRNYQGWHIASNDNPKTLDRDVSGELGLFENLSFTVTPVSAPSSFTMSAADLQTNTGSTATVGADFITSVGYDWTNFTNQGWHDQLSALGYPVGPYRVIPVTWGAGSTRSTGFIGFWSLGGGSFGICPAMDGLGAPDPGTWYFPATFANPLPSGATGYLRFDYDNGSYTGDYNIYGGNYFNTGDVITVKGSALGGVDGGLELAATYADFNAEAHTVNFDSTVYTTLSTTVQVGWWIRGFNGYSKITNIADSNGVCVITAENAINGPWDNNQYEFYSGNDFTATVTTGSPNSNIWYVTNIKGAANTDKYIFNYSTFGGTISTLDYNTSGLLFTLTYSTQEDLYFYSDATESIKALTSPNWAHLRSAIYNHTLAAHFIGGSSWVTGPVDNGVLARISNTNGGTLDWVKNGQGQVYGLSSDNTNLYFFGTNNYILHCVNATTGASVWQSKFSNLLGYDWDNVTTQLHGGYLYVAGFGYLNNFGRSGVIVDKVDPATGLSVWTRFVCCPADDLYTNYDYRGRNMTVNEHGVFIVGYGGVKSNNYSNAFIAKIPLDGGESHRYNGMTTGTIDIDWQILIIGNVDGAELSVYRETGSFVTLTDRTDLTLINCDVRTQSWGNNTSLFPFFDATTTNMTVGAEDHDPTDVPQTQVDWGNSNTYYLQYSDRGRFIRTSWSYTGDVYIRVPSDSQVNFPVGTVITLINMWDYNSDSHYMHIQTYNTDQWGYSATVYLAGNGHGYSPSWGLKGRGTATLMKVGPNEWLLSGANIVNTD